MGLAVGVGLKLCEKWKAFTEMRSGGWDMWRLVCGEREKKAAWVWGWCAAYLNLWVLVYLLRSLYHHLCEGAGVGLAADASVQIVRWVTDLSFCSWCVQKLSILVMGVKVYLLMLWKAPFSISYLYILVRVYILRKVLHKIHALKMKIGGRISGLVVFAFKISKPMLELNPLTRNSINYGSIQEPKILSAMADWFAIPIALEKIVHYE